MAVIFIILFYMTKKSFSASVLPRMRAFASRFIKRGDSVLVGFSGGPDSVCLLHFLNYLSKEKHFELATLHVNHSLRGADALADQKFCKAFCAEWNIPFFTKKIAARQLAKKWNLSLEHAARKGRYQALADVAKKWGATKVALGHHLDDQAETVLLNILRGTKAKGLCGIPVRRPLATGVEIVRPLLCITRVEVEAYLAANALSCVTDQTNADDAYTRNWIRHRLLPFMEEKQPQIRAHLSGMAQELQELFEEKNAHE